VFKFFKTNLTYFKQLTLNIGFLARHRAENQRHSRMGAVAPLWAAPRTKESVHSIPVEQHTVSSRGKLRFTGTVNALRRVAVTPSFNVLTCRQTRAFNRAVGVVKTIAKRIIALAAVPSGEAHSRVESDKIVLSHYSFLPLY